MIANMNEKGRQVKLLAAIAVLAMVACAVAVVLPAESDGAIPTDPNAQLVNEVGDIVQGTGESDVKIYRLNANLDLTSALTIGQYTVLYTNGFTITADSTNTLTIEGTLYINGTNGSVVLENGTSNIATVNTSGEIIVDTNGSLKVGTSNSQITWIGTDGYAVVNSGSMTVITNTSSGYTATVNENSAVTLNDFVINSRDVIEVSEGATLSIAGTVTGNGTIENDGTVNFTGTGNALQSLFTATNSTYPGVNAYYTNGTFGTLSALNVDPTSLSVHIRLYGSDNTNFTLNGGTLSFAALSSYTGVVSWNDSIAANGDVPAHNVTQTVRVSVTGAAEEAITAADNTGLVIKGVGVDGNYTKNPNTGITDVMISSNVVITDARATSTGAASTIPSITVTDVLIQGTLSAPISISNGCATVATGTELRMNQNASFEGAGNIATTTQGLIILGYLLEGNVTAGNQISDMTTSSAGGSTVQTLFVMTDSLGKVSSFMSDTSRIILLTANVVTIDSQEDLDDILLYANNGPIQIGTASTDTYYVFEIKDNLTLGNTTVYVPGNVIIVIGDWDNFEDYYSGLDITVNAGDVFTYGDSQRGSLTLNGTTIESTDSTGANAADGRDTIAVDERNALILNGAKVFAVVYADADLVTANNVEASYVNTTSRVVVGYGSTLNLSGDVETDITVYGNLIISEDVTFSAQSEMNVYRGANVTVNGSLEILGTAEFYDGSTTTVNGTIVMDNGTDGAEMTVGQNPYSDDVDDVQGANFTISESGTVRLAAPSSGYTQYNTIVVNNGEAQYQDRSWSPRFIVLGTLEVRGAISGHFYDMGTVTINGYVDGTATIVLFPGNTVTVTSVTDGTLCISDKGTLAESDRADTIADDSARDVSDGNCIDLQNVRNVTISVAQQSTSYENEDGDNITDYYTVMDVSGTFAANRETVADTTSSVEINSTEASTINGVGRYNSTVAYVQISGDVTVGRSVDLSFEGGNTQVSGNVTVMAQASDSVQNSSNATISNNAEVTVTGHITVFGAEIDQRDGINAMHYIVLNEDGDDIHHYTGFAAAIAVTDAEEDTVEVFGNVTVTETATIPAGLNVDMDADASLTVDSDVTLTLANGAKLDGSVCEVIVDGTFTIENVAEDLLFSEEYISADVVVENLPAKTWTSLANALADAEAGDRIVLNQKVTIRENTTIPEGVEVYTNISVDAPVEDEAVISVVNDARLTVNGTLAMDRLTGGWIDISDGELVVNGVFYAYIGTDTVDEYETDQLLTDIAGAHYGMYSSSYIVAYISNVNYAATTVSANPGDLIGAVTIKGSVSATDASFVGTVDEQIVINVVPLAQSNDGITVFNMTNATLTLTNATLNATSSYVRVTGNIATTDAGFALANAGNFIIRDYSDGDGVTETRVASYTVNNVIGNISGSITLASGEAVINAATAVANDAYFGVDAGATLTVEATLTIQPGADEETFVVDGTIVMDDQVTVNADSEMTVNGTMNVENFTIQSEDKFRVTGTVNIAEDCDLTIDGYLILGDKIETLGSTTSGDISGVVSIGAGGAILAYAGSNLGNAEIDINPATGESDANVTSYVINGEAYATIYLNGTNTADIVSLIGSYSSGTGYIDGAIDLVGWDTPNMPSSGPVWYATQDFNPATDDSVDDKNIGEYGTVYAEFAASEIPGQISKDAGIILTIDDKVVVPSGGYGDQSFTAKLDLSVGTHTIAWSERTGYNIENVTVTFNGQAVENGGTITITADMTGFTIIAEGAVPGAAPGGDTSSDDGMGLTDYLLIVLVVLIVIMAIMVALRLMRS